MQLSKSIYSYSQWRPVHLDENFINFVQVSGEKDEIMPKKYVIMTDIVNKLVFRSACRGRGKSGRAVAPMF